jgi:hypothetical protein
MEAVCDAHAAKPVGRRTAFVRPASIARAVAPLKSAKGSPPERMKIKALDLVGQIAQPSRSGETPPSGDQFRLSFRPRTLKMRTGKPAEPAPFSAGHR